MLWEEPQTQNQNYISSFKTDFLFLICFLLLFFLHQYNAFRAKRREIGYSEEDLKESYGFLLFDDVNKVKTWSPGAPEKWRVIKS